MALEAKVEAVQPLPHKLAENSRFGKPWIKNRIDGFFFPHKTDVALAIALYSLKASRPFKRIYREMLDSWKSDHFTFKTAARTVDYAIRHTDDPSVRRTMLFLLAGLDSRPVDSSWEFYFDGEPGEESSFHRLRAIAEKEKQKYGGYLLKLRDKEIAHDTRFFPRAHEEIFQYMWSRKGDDGKRNPLWHRWVSFGSWWDTRGPGGNTCALTVNVPITLQDGNYFQVGLDQVAELLSAARLPRKKVERSLLSTIDRWHESLNGNKRSYVPIRTGPFQRTRRARVEILIDSKIDYLPIWERAKYVDKMSDHDKRWIVGYMPPELQELRTPHGPLPEAMPVVHEAVPQLAISVYMPSKYGFRSQLSVGQFRTLLDDAERISDALEAKVESMQK